jgi:predicted RNase H-like HicB family nuclease
MKYAVVYEKTSTGYSAYVPDAAASPRATELMMREAIEAHLQAMKKDGDPIPEPTTVTDYITVLT